MASALLSETIFYLADLGGADLSGADLRRAVLRSAILVNTRQDGTMFTGALMPDNTVHP